MGKYLLSAAVVLGLVGFFLLDRAREDSGPANDGLVTFNRDIAPIVWARCAECHREGEVAPFPLTTYGQVTRRSKAMIAVIDSGFMPPWLPEETGHPFRDARHIDPEEVELFRRWIETGMLEGKRSQLPDPPEWPQGWQLGEPDVVVELDPAYRLAAEGPDEFRNFVIEAPVEISRWVRAVEFRAGESAAIHHSLLQVDRSSSCRRLDTEDPLQGFSGMGMGSSGPPNGHFMGWTPGKKARPNPDGTAWELRPKSDMVLQLHMTRTGKEEPVAPRIGLHFGDGPPDRPLHTTLLFTEAIDIPAGRSHHIVSDRYTVPIDVDLLSVYPHAHYLGRRVTLTVETPDGEKEELFRIDHWDFDWQDEYHYLEPVHLKANSVLEMEWTFDNSAENHQNPNSPPRRVRYGLESSDEMATMSLMLFPKNERELFELRASSATHTISKRPSDGPANNALGVTLIDLERYEEAAIALEKATALTPFSSDAWTNLGIARIHQKRSDLAVDCLLKALDIDDSNEKAHQHLGRAYIALERPRRALDHYKEALAEHPAMVDVRMDWANLLAATGRSGTAIRQYEAILKVMPKSADVYNNLGNAMASAGRREDAVAKYEKAIQLRPDHFDARANLGRTLVALGKLKEARPHIEEALHLRPGDPATTKLLKRAMAN